MSFDLRSCSRWIQTCCSQTAQWVSAQAQATASSLLSRAFYVGYDPLKPTVSQERRGALIREKGAEPLHCSNSKGQDIDALYIPSSSSKRTGNVLVIALNTSYQDHHPRHYEHYLENGADIVLWNPTVLKGKQVSEDLASVLKKLRTDRPTQNIVVKSYCASTEPSIAAVAAMDDPNISLIVDRGYGDIEELARSFTICSQLPFVKKVLQREFACDGLSKVMQIKGRVLFIAPPPKEDQVMHAGQGKNLTYELFEKRMRAPFAGDELLVLQDSDHWTLWSVVFCNRVNEFLCENRIIATNYRLVTSQVVPDPIPPSFFKRYFLPTLTKAWC